MENDLIRRSDIRYITENHCYGHGDYEMRTIAFKEEIKRIPAVDAVEVVRCRDCVHYQFGFCMRSIMYSKDPNGFCESGERRGDK